ncbi:hypothetical protein Fmac_008805 [Flemingia macrophylla]|uniref:Uncharacterized protein n=1 Tax=Flemingia macrophylla TaxID=520843 RepID=A0ABD1N0W2_9FABA
MAFFFNKTNIASHFRSHSQLLAEDSSLKPFKSYKKSVKQLRKIGDVLTIVVVAGMLSFNSDFDERSDGPLCDRDAVTKYMSELLQERKLGNSNVLKVLDGANIGS